MSFDDEVDELKKELQTGKLDPAQRKDATAKLSEKLKETVASRRLVFSVDAENSEPFISIKHAKTKEHLASVFINEDSSITFQSPLATEDAESEDDEEDAGYFPKYVEYYDEEEFLEDVPDILKHGVAEYELDQETEEKA
ncbi:MAG: hypothetical protein SGJ17_13975 [Hyphomicrobiales bacterium]|nr:hypothetical protein [Hyphomicrobiales bacterium]